MAAGRSMGPKKKTNGTVVKENEEKFVCPHCGQNKKRSDFYVSRDPAVTIGISFPCKSCSEKIARNYNPQTGDFGDVSPTSLQRALEYLDVPYIQKVWDSSLSQVYDESHTNMKSNVWKGYITQINSLKQYRGMRWRDGDLFKDSGETSSFNLQENVLDPESEQYTLYKKNKKAVINFVGWDPFKNYPKEDELPLLYAQLLTFLDDETKNDGQKLNAVIQIVKLFNQAEKINAAIDELQIDTKKIIANTAAVKTLREAASKCIGNANALAKDNGVSLNFNHDKSKGAHTLSGKMKELNEIGLREAKINTYDVGTCDGMRQVAEISYKCQAEQIGFDDSIAQEIKDIKVELVHKLSQERDEAMETARKLLLENKDLKSYLLLKGLVNEDYEVIEDESDIT